MQESESTEEEQMKFLQETPLEEFYLTLAGSLLILGKYLKDIGEFQAKSKVHKLVFQTPELSMDLVMLLGKKMIDEIEEEKIGPLVKTMGKVPSLPPEGIDFAKSSPQELIDFGEKFIAVAKKIEALLK